MSFEHKENSGSLFKNDRRETENHPNYKGDGLINGKEVWISAWVKETKTGSKFMSISFQNKNDVNAVSSSKPVVEFEDEDLPF